jgi:hypothetical protein
MPVRSVASSSTSQARARVPTQLETVKGLTLKASAKPEKTRAGLELTFASKRGDPTLGIRARGESLYLVTDGKGKQLEGAELKAAATKLKSLARGATGEVKDTLKHFADVAEGKTAPANTGWTPRARTTGGRGSDVSTRDSRERIATMYTGGRGSDQSTARTREAITRIYTGGTGSGSSFGSSYGSGYSSGGRGS